MYQGSSTVQVFCLDKDLSDCTVYLDMRTATGEIISKSGQDLIVTVENGVTSIALVLTQEDTLQLPEGVCQVQARWIDKDGNSDSSDAASIEIRGILNRRVITYEEVDE